MKRATVRRSREAQIQEEGWGRLVWYARRSLGNSEDMTVGLCVLKPGMSNPRHYHPNCSEVLVVWKGKITHTIHEKKEVVLREGDCVTIPPLLFHQARNVGKTEAVLFIAFSSADRQAVFE